MSVNSKRKTVLPLHIDTTSFTGGQTQTSGYIWRRINKRQLPIYILLSILVSSLLLNIIQHRRSSQTTYTYDLLPPIPLKDKTHAIIVAGHAIYTGAPNVSDLSSDDNWILEPYQQGGQVNTFIQHIETGIDILKRDTHSVLIFSGGETRPKAGPISESYSYWMISKLLLAERGLDELVERTITEEYAKDSYENLLYSICRFSEMTGNYPSKITVVGFEFKRDRFESIHRYAIKYPSDKFEYIGIDPDWTEKEQKAVQENEMANAYKPFKKDLYGCHGSLKEKKINRNPYRRRHAYSASCPTLTPLFNYCPLNNVLYSGLLPWVQ